MIDLRCQKCDGSSIEKEDDLLICKSCGAEYKIIEADKKTAFISSNNSLKIIAAIIVGLVFISISYISRLNNKIDTYIIAIDYQNKGQFKEAISNYEKIKNFKNSIEQIEYCNKNIDYLNAINLLKENKYGEAKDLFEKTKDFKESKTYIAVCLDNLTYNQALELMKLEKYQEAKEIFEKLDDFKDSKNKIEHCNYGSKILELKNSEIGSLVTYGSYEQDESKDGLEPIEWIVLDNKDNKILLLSKYGLESKNYNDKNDITDWEKCFIRQWLNNDFYETSFNSIEKYYIANTEVIQHKHKDFDTEQGNNTIDRVFLLSLNELEKYKDSLVEKNNIICEPSNYVKKQKDFDNTFYRTVKNTWRLRTLANSMTMNTVYNYNNGGYSKWFVSFGDSTSNKGLIRPAMWVKLSFNE